jgi:hypothetical protein
VLQQITADKLTAFRLGFVRGLAKAGAVVDETLALTPGSGAILLVRTHALTRGVWQSAYRSQGLRAVDKPGSTRGSTFGTELTEALSDYWGWTIEAHTDIVRVAPAVRHCGAVPTCAGRKFAALHCGLRAGSAPAASFR